MNPARLVKEKLRGDSPPGSKNAPPVPQRGLPSFPEPLRPAMRRLSPRPLLLALLAALALAAGAGAWAQEPPRERRGGEDRPRAGAEQDPRAQRGRGEDPLSDSVRRFERSNRGSRVLSAERMQSDGRDVNRIKAMDDRGRVRVYVDDPARQRPEPSRPEPPRGGGPARDDND